MARSPKKRKSNPRDVNDELRQRILKHFEMLRIPVLGVRLDEVLHRAERERLGRLAFLDSLLSPEAAQRRERAVAYRISRARFLEQPTLESFDWNFNKQTIDRTQIEELATGDFIRRKENVVFAGDSGVGKSHLIQAIGVRACGLGYRVRYNCSGSLIQELGAALAEKRLPQALRSYSKIPLLIIDEFGLDRLEREESPRAMDLLFRLIQMRQGKAATAVVTNLDFEQWPTHFNDAPLAMALLDRIVDGAIILKMNGKSYRAERARRKAQQVRAVKGKADNRS